jgi:glycosyltransferase involved in cell wall biosynthesis
VAEYAVVTTLNEGRSIGQLVAGLLGEGFEVIVIDDASEDDTQAAAYNAGAEVVVTGTLGRLGIAQCLMRAWRRALRQGATCVVQVDAGGSHKPQDARLLADTLAVVQCDLVIGSRFRPGAVYDNQAGRRWRPAASRAAATACNLAIGAQYTDWTSGLRAFSPRAMNALLDYPYLSRMHGWQIEVLGRAHSLGLRIVEQPIEYTAGRSSFNGKVASEAVNAWLQLFFHMQPCTDNNRLSVQQGGRR